MSDETVRLSMIGQIVRRRWRLLAVIAVVGALLGAGASLLLSPGYRTATTVLMQGQREQDELATEAEIAMSSVVLDHTAAALGWGFSGSDLRGSVSAELLDGNVIEIRGTAETPERAQQLADRMAEEYVAFSTQLASNTSDATAQVLREQREVLRGQIAQTIKFIDELQESASQGDTEDEELVRAELEKLRVALQQATTDLQESEAASGQANMVIMGRAERPTSPAPPTTVHLIVGGAVLAFLLGVFGHLVAARADRRLRGEPEIAAALGSSILASVDVPDETPAADAGARLGRLRRLVLDGRPWDLPQLQASGNGQLGWDARYRRVLTRLRGWSPTPSRVLVLVADDDVIAHRAVARLAAMAEADGGPPPQVVDVSPGRPTVPDRDRVSGVLVIVTVGTRTAWELVAIAEACSDAGHEILGAVVVYPTRPAGGKATKSRKITPEPPEAPADRDAMAGSA